MLGKFGQPHQRQVPHLRRQAFGRGIHCVEPLRQRGIGLSRREPLTLNDCLEKLGLAPLESEDAALRALAIRALWRKLDGVE